MSTATALLVVRMIVVLPHSEFEPPSLTRRAMRNREILPRVLPTQREAAGRLLAGGSPLDAVFCANDLVAFGVIDAFRAMGRHVPGDMMVAGFDDIPEAGWDSYGITTIGESHPTMVEASLDILRRIDDAALSWPIGVTVPIRLIQRQSTESSPRRAAPR